MKSPREKRVEVGPVLSDGTLCRAVNESGNVVAERWDSPSKDWVRSGVSLGDVMSGRDVTGEEMETLGCPA